MASILVVDDTPDMVTLMTMAVKKQGYTAMTACNGYQAMELAATMRPDAILLDVMMPGMDGLQVLSALKKDPALRDIPVILVTAKGEDDDVISGLDAGAHDYVTKPFKQKILAARMRSAVRIKQHHDTLLTLTQQLQKEITERERMQRELTEAQKLESIGQLAAGIAHEINTPAQYVGDNTRFLQDVFSSVDQLLGDLDRLLDAAKHDTITEALIADVDQHVRNSDVAYIKDQAPKAIQQSLEGIERVSSIVRAMKEFSHPSTLDKQLVDINRSIASAVTVARNEWKYVAELVTEYDAELPLVPCRVCDLNQAILNLLLNAAQAIASVVGDGLRGKGTITVTTRHAGDWAEIRVRDTGTGIPASIHSKVFDQFFTTKEVGKGTGLGLSITHAIVQNHGGSIDFETEEGKGTVFIVRLPLHAPAATECISGTPPGSPGSRSILDQVSGR